MKAKRITLDEFNYELISTALGQMINNCQHDHNKTAENNYRKCLADLKEKPWVTI